MAKTKLPRDEFIIDFFKGDLFEVAEEARERKMITIPGETRNNSDIMYQINLAKMYKNQAKKLYFDKIQGKSLTDSDIQRINGDLKRISDNAGDVQWTLRSDVCRRTLSWETCCYVCYSDCLFRSNRR